MLAQRLGTQKVIRPPEKNSKLAPQPKSAMKVKPSPAVTKSANPSFNRILAAKVHPYANTLIIYFF
jgi:hypothetical protein